MFITIKNRKAFVVTVIRYTYTLFTCYDIRIIRWYKWNIFKYFYCLKTIHKVPSFRLCKTINSRKYLYCYFLLLLLLFLLLQLGVEEGDGDVLDQHVIQLGVVSGGGDTGAQEYPGRSPVEGEAHRAAVGELGIQDTAEGYAVGAPPSAGRLLHLRMGTVLSI